MEDENGLELSLGLSCGGGSSVKSKGKNGASSNTRVEEGERDNKLTDDFKDFLHGGTQKQESSSSSQRSDSVKPKENFFNDLSKANGDADTSMNLNGRGVWVAKNNKSDEIEERQTDAGNKRKTLFEDMNNQKKHEREAHYTDMHDKTRASHISTTEEGSTAENEDVADSEVEGSVSRLIPQHDDGSKRFVGSGDSSDAQKELRRFADSSSVDPNGQKRFNVSSENDYKVGNVTYGSPFSMQSVNMMNMPYSLPTKDYNPVGAPSTSAHLIPGMMQVMPIANSERSGTQPMNPGNLPVMFGYSAVQLPVLDKDNSWGVPHTQQFHYAGRTPPNPAVMQVVPQNASESAQYDGRVLERAKGGGKQHVTEEGSSSQAEEDMKVTSSNPRTKDAPDHSMAEDFSLDFSAIKPGIAADIKFGGSGSCPNLPWVSTKGPGPNGRTISGVTYRYSANQIRIVCACHGSHMSPEEFVRHASEEPSNPENSTGLATVPNGNPAASAQS
ncbi:ninja-family protein mc410 [Argentina anserina]|uniref:ninja-family protein mc410 n=1 Tax=Argentina anserina TaxID=57926 RepID=UPI00217652FC|nr:ninja-family protein mc410 [Potentilla anserina]